MLGISTKLRSLQVSGLLARTLCTSRTIRVLGIETSCDETAAAVVSSNREVLGEAIHSQMKEQNQLWGGVYPHEAAKVHRKHIDGIVDEALRKSGLTLKDIDAIACTTGPGLAPCLGVGLDTAKRLVAESGKPFIGVNHLEAHALTPRLLDHTFGFPFLILLASGGNCQLVLAEDFGRYFRLGQTQDDAPGEAFDKVARALGLDMSSMSGGQALEIAAGHASEPIKIGEPLAQARDCRFSFAGIKARARHLAQPSTNEQLSWEQKCNLAAGFQKAALGHIVTRTRRAILYARTRVPHLDAVVVSGGVASNKELRRLLDNMAENYGVRVLCPPPRLCTDNGVMIAWAGLERYQRGLDTIHDPQLVQDVRYEPRWPLGEDVAHLVAEANLHAPPRMKRRKI